MWLWWVYSALVFVVVTPIVAFLAVRIVRTALEILRYADEIRTHGGGIVTALEPLPALSHTVELVAEIDRVVGSFAGAAGSPS